MVGTGVFTSLGFQVGGVPSGFAILMLWLIGGVSALCGALCYGELAAALPRSGGEYHLIGRTIHPAAGFLAGWLSATIGFAAPIALAAMALAKYAAGIFPALNEIHFQPWARAGTGPAVRLFEGPEIVALLVVGLVTLIHLRGLRLGALFQNGATLLKLALISFLVIAGFLAGGSQPIRFLPAAADAGLFISAPFAISLVYVMYAYSGWNASTYIVGEIRDPARNVPRSLIFGTGFVALLYLGLNAIFLRTTPVEAMRGKVEVGLIAGEFIFGPVGGKIIGGFICLGLIASISAMTWIGPRVTATMGADLVALRWLAIKESATVPTVALLVQLLLVGVLIVTSTFEKVLVYVQFGLTLFSFLTVIGLIVLRVRQPELPRPFRVPAYPLPPLVFLAISGWMLWHVFARKPAESLAGLATLGAGLLIYFLSPKNPASRTS